MTSARARRGVVVTGGGTAGHVLPALTVARALVDAGHPIGSVHFVGSRRGMEGRLVPEAGFSVTVLPGRGVERALTLRSALALAALAIASVRAVLLLARLRPSVVVAVAGYASVPASLAAALLRVPIVVVNIDSVPGAANRLVGRFAAACAVAWPGTSLPRAIVTGPPVRPEVLAADRSPAGRAAARATLGVAPDRVLVVVTGGSLGARSLNDAALALASGLAERGRIALYHVTGARDHERVVEAARAIPGGEGSGPDYRVVGYEDAMSTVLAAADLVVARAGASTLAEICAVGVASVLVPLPGAPSDHQRRNAEVLEKAGAAVIVDDADLLQGALRDAVSSLVSDPGRLVEMGAAARALVPGDGAARIAAVVDEVASRRVRRGPTGRGARGAPRGERS